MTSLIPFNRKRGDVFNTNFDDFYNVIDDFFSDSFPVRRSLQAETFKVDVKEEADRFEIVAEMPGVQKDELNVSLEDGKLTIEVNRNETVESQEETYLHREIRRSSMKRSIYLKDINADEINAKMEDGMLKLFVPKSAKVEKRKLIEIQ